MMEIQMIPTSKILYKGKEYDQIKKMLKDMANDGLSPPNIKKLLVEMGFDKSEAQDLLISYNNFILKK